MWAYPPWARFCSRAIPLSSMSGKIIESKIYPPSSWFPIIKPEVIKLDLVKIFTREGRFFMVSFEFSHASLEEETRKENQSVHKSKKSFACEITNKKLVRNITNSFAYENPQWFWPILIYLPQWRCPENMHPAPSLLGWSCSEGATWWGGIQFSVLPHSSVTLGKWLNSLCLSSPGVNLG